MSKSNNNKIIKLNLCNVLKRIAHLIYLSIYIFIINILL